MGDCHLPLTYCNPNKCEEKYCRYTYSAWCPICEKSSPRRRSRSETSTGEFCRRKCKEMKAPSPRKHTKSQEYENMDLEYESRDYWYDPKDTYRIRSNLCELPTSYITNNFQTTSTPTSTSSNNKLSGSVKNCDKLLMGEDGCCKMKPQGDFVDALHHNSSGKKTSPYRNHHSQDNQFSDFRNTNRDISYDTCTYFDKIVDTSNFKEQYAKEVQAMREKLEAYRTKENKVLSTNLPSGEVTARPFPNVSQAYDRYAKEAESVRAKWGCFRAPALPPPQVPLGEAVKSESPRNSNNYNNNRRVSVKIRRNLSSVKLRRLKSKSTSIPHESSGSDSVASDGSDTEPSNDVDAETTSDEVSAIEYEPPKPNKPEAGDRSDVVGWPVRHSLFPHVPPYVRFTPHDDENPVKLPAGRKFFKWKLSSITPVVVRKTLTNSGFALVRKSNQWSGTWGKHMKSPLFKTLKETQKLNHFPGTFQLGRKDRLWRNFQRLINKHGYKEFGFIPQTFVLPQELKLLKQNWEYKNGSGGETWIIKPPASARGVGIKVINKWSQLPKKMSLVVQRYISNPYLINGSKFDLRLYVLVTSFDPLRIYLYPEGLARFASAKYSVDAKDLRDRYMHLTNYSINKLSSQYTANEDANACQGHKWTLSKLFDYLEGQKVDTRALWRKLQDLVIKTVITGEAPIRNLCAENIMSRYNCYELFGVDVLLDANLKPWLLEVNISPSLHSASPLDLHVKGPLVHTLFDLAQFHFPQRLAQNVRQSPRAFESKLYTTALTKKERDKHQLFEQYELRDDYLGDILDNLTGDDVRRLIQAEDEFVVKGRFERIFPTAQSHKYLTFMEPRYYNRLFDAWECKYEKNRLGGVEVLKTKCASKVHLKAANHSVASKSSPSTIPVDLSPFPSKEGQSRPLTEVLQEVSIGKTPSCSSNNNSAIV